MNVLEIKRPCSPSKVLSDILIKTTEILVSWGGGMGGASKTYYTISNDGDTYTLVNGEKIELNPRFIVHKKNVNIVKVVTDTTQHSNYHDKKVKRSVVTRYHKLPFGYEYRIDMYGTANNSANDIIAYLTERVVENR